MANHLRLDKCNDTAIRSTAYTALEGYIRYLGSADYFGKMDIKDFPNFDIEGLTQYLDSYTIEAMQLITVDAKSSSVIASTANQPTYCMLMLPILGISNITVDWFKRSGTAVINNNELVFKRDLCYTKDHAKLDGTSLIKTFTPYCINNPNPYRSIVLAIKLKKEPIELLNKDVFEILPGW